MFIQKTKSYSASSKWKFIQISDDNFLVNGSKTKEYIKVCQRFRCSKVIECEGDVEDIELFTSDVGFIFKFYNDIYEITGAVEIEALELMNYDYENEDVLLIATHDKKELTFISFWHDEKAEGVETFQELQTIDLSLLPSVNCLDDFMKRIVYHDNFFFYRTVKSDRVIIRFSSERIDTYEIPEDAIFYFDTKYEKYLYVRFNTSFIDVFNFKLYDISDILALLGNDISRYNIEVFNLINPNLDFIFLYEGQNAFAPSLVTKGIFTDVKGFLYDYTHKRFVFNEQSTKPQKSVFKLYDYTVPNIIENAPGFRMFYIDKNEKIVYCDLPFDITVLTGLDKEASPIWNRVIFITGQDSKSEEDNSFIMLKNSVCLGSIIDYSSLSKIIYMDDENDAIKFIISQRFDRNVSGNTPIINETSYKKVHYLYIDDCFIIDTPFSEYGKYTLVIPKNPDKVDFNLSFDSYKKFVLFRKEKDKSYYEHLILKCFYKAENGEEKVAYIDVTKQETVCLEDLIDDAFNYE